MNPTTSKVESNELKHESPKWNWTTKLVVGLALVALAIWLLILFQGFLGSIITAFILAFLIHPIASFLQKKVKLPWRLSVTIVYLLLVLVIVGLVTWGGFALVEQIQNLVRFIENNINQLPDLISELTTQTYHIGPFEFTPFGFNWDELTNEIVRATQAVLGQVGTFASSIASGAVSVVSYLVLILLVSYFLLAESEGIPSRFLNIKIPMYAQDLERMSSEINRIWNAFIRGELLVVFFSLIIYTTMLGAMGIQFFFGLALIAAVGQLIPYLGAWITWITFGLVALFQAKTPYNLLPGTYMLIVLGVSIIINNIIDNILRTKVMAQSLKVHPAVVLIGALIGVQLFGFIGIVIAAPIMASLKLFLNYTIMKLTDQNPWAELDYIKPTKKTKCAKVAEDQWSKFGRWITNQWGKIWNK